MHRPALSRRGFTLTELLIVIGLIAILLGLLLPTVGAVRRRGRAMQCLNQLRTIGQAVQGYLVDHRSYYPLSSHSTGRLYGRDSWLQSLEPYGVTEHSRLCPDDPHADSRETSYVTNDHFEALQAGIDYNPITGEPIEGGRTKAYQREIDLPSPTAVAYAVEGAGDGTQDHLNTAGWTTAEQVAEDIAVERHDGGANYLFADGHVEFIEWLTIESTFAPEHNFLDPGHAR